jgi:hypothetical protein
LTPRIDAYTDKGGQGENVPGGNFTTNETIHVYVEVWDDLNRTISGQLISLEVLKYGGGHFRFYVNTTNASGIATITNPIDPTGTWTYEDVATWNDGRLILTDVVTIVVEFAG